MPRTQQEISEWCIENGLMTLHQTDRIWSGNGLSITEEGVEVMLVLHKLYTIQVLGTIGLLPPGTHTTREDMDAGLN